MLCVREWLWEKGGRNRKKECVGKERWTQHEGLVILHSCCSFSLLCGIRIQNSETNVSARPCSSLPTSLALCLCHFVIFCACKCLGSREYAARHFFI